MRTNINDGGEGAVERLAAWSTKSVHFPVARMARQLSLGAYGVTRNDAPIPLNPLPSPPRPDADEAAAADPMDEDEKTQHMPADEIHRIKDPLGARRILVTCSPMALIGREMYGAVLFDPALCKPKLRAVMMEISALEPGDITDDTAQYLVGGPGAVASLSNVDARIRHHRRKSLGLVDLGDAPELTLWCVDDD